MVTLAVGVSNPLALRSLLAIWREGASAITQVPFFSAFRGHRDDKVILTHEVFTPKHYHVKIYT